MLRGNLCITDKYMNTSNLKKIDYGSIQELEDILRITKLYEEPAVPNLTIFYNHVTSIERTLKQARQTIKYSDDKDAKVALDDLESEIDVIISDIDDLTTIIEEFQNYAARAEDAISDWRSMFEHRLDDDEKSKWAAVQVANKMIRAIGK